MCLVFSPCFICILNELVLVQRKETYIDGFYLFIMSMSLYWSAVLNEVRSCTVVLACLHIIGTIGMYLFLRGQEDFMSVLLP